MLKKRFSIIGGVLLMVIFASVINWHKHRIMNWLSPPPSMSILAAPLIKPLPPRTFERLRGVHYFADTYPKQFWNSFEPADAARDFKQIRADGFNSIVLVVPWAEFQPSLIDRKHDERMFVRLKGLMDAAERENLGIVLRVSYYWTYRPNAEEGATSRTVRLFHDDGVRAAWLDHLGEIYRRVGGHPAFRLAFLSWEDLYPMELATAPEILRDKDLLRVYRSYLSRTSRLGDVAALYGQTFTSWDQLPFPERKSPAYAKVFDYWDDALLNRLFIPANARFPNLSFEVRVDWDPIWEADGKINSKNHAFTYPLPGTNTRTSYYAPSWGMKNVGDFATAEDALKGFDRYVAHVQEGDATRHLFIDQLLFYYSLPGHMHNTQVKPEERGKFLEGVATRLKEKDISYSLWYYRDYVDNVLYNAHFSLGLEGWNASAGVRAVSLDSGRHAVVLSRGDAISQHVPAKLRTGWNVFDKPHNICLTRAGDVTTAAQLKVSSGVGKQTIAWQKDAVRACGKIYLGASFELLIASDRDDVTLNKTELYAMLEPSDVYGVDGQASPQLGAVRRLNAIASGILPAGR